MKMRLQFAISVLFVLLASSCSKESVSNTDIPIAENAVQVERELLTLVNDHRRTLGLQDLEYSAVAYEYANGHNDYMISKGALSHDNWEDRASKISSEVNAKAVGENVAKDYPSASVALAGWLASSDHKNTIEDNFTHTAISVKKDSAGNLYYTQLFYR